MGDTLVIKCGTLIDGTGGKPARNMVVIFEGSKIAEVGEGLTAPQGARIIDAAGKTVMPGLIDGHVHLNLDPAHTPESYVQRSLEDLTHPDSMSNLRAAKNARISLEAGYTSLLGSIGWGNYADLFLREAICNGWIPGPRLWTSGPGVASAHRKGRNFKFGVPLHPLFAADGVEAVRRLVRLHVAAGVDYIKVFGTDPTSGLGESAMMNYSAEELRAVMEEAHARWKKVKAHLEGRKTTKEALDAGVDIVLHGFFLDDDDVEFMRKKGIPFIPTLSWRGVAEKGFPGMPEWYLQKTRRYGPPHLESFKRAYEAGVLIAAGSDCPYECPHGENAREIEFLARYGMTPMEAIKAGTRSVAEAFGLSELVGSIEPGKLADIIVVEGDPLKDVTVLNDRRRIETVIKNGDIVVRDGVAVACACPPLEPHPPGFLAEAQEE